jgi:NTE family protein
VFIAREGYIARVVSRVSPEVPSMLRSLAMVVSAAVLLWHGDAGAQTCAREPVTDRARIGLVLGGGGARGSAHIGVIRVLEEMKVPVDYVAGTSMGSLIGGFYAAGMTSDELEKTVLGIDWGDIFNDETRREDEPFRRKRDDDYALFAPKLGVGRNSTLLPKGAISGQKISYLFEHLASDRARAAHFDDLPIPYRAVAADILTGDKVVLDEGNLAVAMRSSMSIPGVFDPVVIGDHLLVDGGIVDNVPVDVARDMGAQVLIVVSVGSPLATREQLSSLVSVTGQLTGIMIVKNAREQIATLDGDDVLIEPALGTAVTTGSFDKSAEAIKLGYEAADAARAQLARYSLSSEAYAAHRRYIEGCVSALPAVEFVRLDNQSRFSDDVLLDRLNVEVGQPLDAAELERDIQQIYALGYLDLVRYEVVTENDETGIIVHVTQDSRGTRFIEGGLDYSGNDVDSGLNIRVGYLKTDIDETGAELRLLTQLGQDMGFLGELYKPFGRQLRTIFLPQVFWEDFDFIEYDEDGNALNQFAIEDYGASLALGREFSRHAAIFVGLRRYSGDVDVNIGNPEVSDFDFDGGEYTLGFQYDRLDDRYFPSTGSFVTLEYVSSSESLGADAEFDQVTLAAFRAWTKLRNSLQLGLRYYTTLDDDAPVYALFRGGGFTSLSGYRDGELAGQHFGNVFAGYRYEVARTGFFPAYAGLTVEYGNAADDREDIWSEGILNGSLFFGYRSPLGPIYAGFGFAEDGRDAFFLRIGNPFGISRLGVR